MAQFQRHFVQELTKPLIVRQCGDLGFTGDNLSDVISVDLYTDGEAYSGGGTCAGACICPDGSTVALNGSVSGKTASVTLTEDCFALPGQIGIGIRVTSGTTKTTVLKAIYNVEQFSTNNPVDPGSRISLDVGDLVNRIDAATADIPASDMASLMAGIAPTFSATTAYPAGAYVYYNGTLYRFTTAHAAGSWTGTDATQVALSNDLGSQVSDLKSTITPVSEYAFDGIYSITAAEIEQGGISGSTGGDETNPDLHDKRLRTIGKIPVKKGFVVSFTAGEKITHMIAYFYRNGEYVAHTGWETATTINVAEDGEYRLLFKSGADGTAIITPSDFDATVDFISIIGNRIDNIESTLSFTRKVYTQGGTETYSVSSGIRTKYGDVNTSDTNFVHIDFPVSFGGALYYSGIGFGSANFPVWVMLDANNAVIDYADKWSRTENELCFISNPKAAIISINGRTNVIMPTIYKANEFSVDEALSNVNSDISKANDYTRQTGQGVASAVQDQFYVMNSVAGKIPVVKLFGKVEMNAPSIANPTEIHVAGGANGLTLYTSSGNLLPDQRNSHTYNGITATPTADGGYWVEGTASAATDLYLCGQDMIRLPKKGLSVSGGTSNVCVMLWIYSENKTYLGNAYSFGGVFGPIRSDAVYYRMIIQIASGNVCHDKVFPMLYDADLVTDFTPAEQSKIIFDTSDTYAAIPAAYYGNYVDGNGGRWFADEINLRDKCIYRRVKAFTIDENSSISEYNTGRGHYFSVTVPDSIYKGTDGVSLGVICDRLPATGVVALWENDIDGISVSGDDNSDSLRFRVSSVSSVTDVATLKTWLASNPLTGYYLLDYEEQIGLSQEQIDALETIQSYDGLTCIWSDDDYPVYFDYQVLSTNIAENVQTNKNEAAMLRRLLQDNIPTIDCELSHFVGYGQSWSVGGSNSVQQILTKRTDRGNLMFKGGVLAWKTRQTDSTAYSSLVPLHEQKRNGYYETPVSSQCDMVSILLKDENGFDNGGYVLIGSAPGEGDKTISQLSKGTAYYQYFIDYVTAAKQLADAQNKIYMVEAFSWLNASSNADALSQLQIDLNNDIKAITGQSKDVKLITWQHEPHSLNDDVYSGFVAVHETNSNIFCAFPGYVIPRINDGVLAPNNIHFTSYGSIICGEYFGIAFKRIVNDGKLFVPVSPQKITLSGKTAVIKFNVPCAPLRFDTEIVNAADNFGFSLSDSSGNAKELVSVSLLGVDCVKLVSNATIQSTDVVSYGYNYSNSSSYAPDAIARGNLCDSQEIASKTGRLLPNFCVCFKKPISYFDN